MEEGGRKKGKEGEKQREKSREKDRKGKGEVEISEGGTETMDKKTHRRAGLHRFDCTSSGTGLERWGFRLSPFCVSMRILAVCP